MLLEGQRTEISTFLSPLSSTKAVTGDGTVRLGLSILTLSSLASLFLTCTMLLSSSDPCDLPIFYLCLQKR